jgi:hypothetical protein
MYLRFVHNNTSVNIATFFFLILYADGQTGRLLGSAFGARLLRETDVSPSQVPVARSTRMKGKLYAGLPVSAAEENHANSIAALHLSLTTCAEFVKI